MQSSPSVLVSLHVILDPKGLFLNLCKFHTRRIGSLPGSKSEPVGRVSIIDPYIPLL
jgi:hypothetical protein